MDGGSNPVPRLTDAKFGLMELTYTVSRLHALGAQWHIEIGSGPQSPPFHFFELKAGFDPSALDSVQFTSNADISAQDRSSEVWFGPPESWEVCASGEHPTDTGRPTGGTGKCDFSPKTRPFSPVFWLCDLPSGSYCRICAG